MHSNLKVIINDMNKKQNLEVQWPRLPFNRPEVQLKGNDWQVFRGHRWSVISKLTQKPNLVKHLKTDPPNRPFCDRFRATQFWASFKSAPIATKFWLVRPPAAAAVEEQSCVLISIAAQICPQIPQRRGAPQQKSRNRKQYTTLLFYCGSFTAAAAIEDLFYCGIFF